MGYPTDLTDKQWDLIEHIFRTHKGQHFVEHSKRDLVNAVLYLVKTGCQWRMLPNDFPPHSTVDSFYYRAVKSGKWEKAMDLLVEKVRKDAGRKTSPSYAIVDSQSVKTTSKSEKEVLTEEKSEGPQEAYRNRYNGKSSCYKCPCGQCSRHKIRY